MELSPAHRRELRDLEQRFGTPAHVDAIIQDGFFDPIRRRDRIGEVCMVVRRPSGKLLLSIKTFYPRGAYRLPTGGIDHGEGIYDALLRETAEETALETEVRRFLARIGYRPVSAPSGPPMFHTFAFLLDETGGTLKVRDERERIEEYVEVAPEELRAVADRLELVTSSYSNEIRGDWSDWGRFRAVVHRAVADALAV